MANTELNSASTDSIEEVTAVNVLEDIIDIMP